MTKPRILFVDDEPHVLDGLQRAMRSRNGQWDMVFQVSPTAAIEEQRRQPFDVAVVDMRMPVMSGVELIKALTALHADTVSIILTGATDIETAIAAINEASVFRFYAKPSTTEVLAAGITQALLQEPAKATASPQASLGLAALNRLPTGIVVVNGSASVLFMNSLGAEYLAGSGGLSMSQNGICRSNRPQETTELHRLIKEAVEGGEDNAAHALSITREDADRPLSVVVAPLPAETGSGRVAVLLISGLERQPLPSLDTVAKLFDLTEAEARLALLLSEGQRIEDAAERLGITVNSARTYLKRIFSKTDVTRQAELVRLILAAPTLVDLGAIRRGKQRPDPEHSAR
ncbi:response regulator [Telmatospirillum sp.]|uniref:response regulator n=1 Tax=Telmatospirillum sp. TaxID=2079197 RepID=UPI0028493C19|nr:response regulator [Telmatospirillum sp.]MDR3435235.1 response regulator [Telmatospirillum sp.]